MPTAHKPGDYYQSDDPLSRLSFIAVADAAKRLPIDTHFNVALANELARLESYNKHHYRPNTYLHKWWARRCGSTFRLILKCLVPDEHRRDFYAPGGLEGKIILDPMMGGGTTLHEAVRLGANVIGVDVDPIPVLQARATLSAISLVTLEEAFQKLRAALHAELWPLFQTRCRHCDAQAVVRFILYGWRRRCGCGPVLSVDSLILHYEPDGTPVHLCPRCHEVTYGEICSCDGRTTAIPIVERTTTFCAGCGERYTDETTPFYLRYQPLAINGRCPEHGQFFARPTEVDRRSMAVANERRANLQFAAQEGADFLNVAPGPKSDVLRRRGIDAYTDLFSSRQLLYLHTAIQHLPQLERLVRLNLALLVSTSLEFNSMLCGYKGRKSRRAGAIRHTFSYHGYFFPHTAVENNPLYPGRASGTMDRLFHDRIRRARRWAAQPQERRPEGNRSEPVPISGEHDFGVEIDDASHLPQPGPGFHLIQGSSALLPLDDESVDYVVTDPPYFDSVQYSDLATYFRVWLRQLLPAEANWEYDRAQSAVVTEDGELYGHLLSQIFGECHRVLRKRNGRLIFTYHHWNPRSWAALTMALQEASFRLINRYVVHSENPMSVHIAGMRALTHDAILVLAPVEAGLGQLWDRPATICQTDSERFCYDCGTLLGWLLNRAEPAADIEATWQELLAPSV